jgi:hypothetical protein
VGNREDMFEQRHHPLASKKVFYFRVVRNLLLGFSIIFLSLCIGMMGYSYFEGMDAVEAYENASMILSGMGPVEELKTDGGKLFAGTYALFSGVVFLIVIAIIIAPLAHRFFHRFLIKESK